MKHGAFFSGILAAVLIAPVAAWADTNPDFDDDAKPILNMQPGLLQYVESRFEVKDTGTAKFPGDDERRPAPPYIFRARPIGAHGPYNLRLLIQPGPAGHILGVVDITKVHLGQPGVPAPGPSVANRAPIQQQGPPPEPFQPSPSAPAPAKAPANPTVQVPELSAGPVDQQPAAQPQQPAPSQPAPAAPQPNEPTADTPSGPIMDSGSQGQSQAPAQPSLTPPPDPAPPAQ
jgi:hypothetical protein